MYFKMQISNQMGKKKQMSQNKVSVFIIDPNPENDQKLKVFII